jgi:hypothetical protein
MTRCEHQAAVKSVAKASSAIEDLSDDVLKGLGRLDDLVGT